METQNEQNEQNVCCGSTTSNVKTEINANTCCEPVQANGIKSSEQKLSGCCCCCNCNCSC